MSKKKLIVIIIIVILVIVIFAGILFAIIYSLSSGSDSSTSSSLTALTPFVVPPETSKSPLASSSRAQSYAPRTPLKITAKCQNGTSYDLNDWGTIDDGYIQGDNINNGYITNISLDDCKSKCDKFACNFVNYNTNSKECWLQKIKDDPNYDTNIKLSTPTDDCYGFYNATNSIVLTNDDIGTYTNKTYDECAQLCNTNNCDVFKYAPTSKQCILQKDYKDINGKKTYVRLAR